MEPGTLWGRDGASRVVVLFPGATRRLFGDTCRDRAWGYGNGYGGRAAGGIECRAGGVGCGRAGGGAGGAGDRWRHDRRTTGGWADGAGALYRGGYAGDGGPAHGGGVFRGGSERA